MSVLSLKTLASFEMIKHCSEEEIDGLNIPPDLTRLLKCLYKQDLEIEIVKDRNFEFLNEYIKFLGATHRVTSFHRKVDSMNVLNDEDFFELIEFLKSIPLMLRSMYANIRNEEGVTILDMKVAMEELMYSRFFVKIEELQEIKDLGL